MSWAKYAIEALQQGERAVIHPRGNSMRRKVNSGDKVTLDPVATDDVAVGDIVLVKVKGHVYLHLVKAVRGGPQFQIGNNRGGINGWVSPQAIYGRATSVEAPS